MQTKSDMTALLTHLKTIAIKAGDVIMQYYQNVDDLIIEKKSNETPVTIADKAAHQLIFDALKKITPDIPILSEEGKTISFAQRQQWQRYWLVDPLDGTKEFIAKTDEFSVNIALIDNHQPILSVVYAPALHQLYYAIEGEAFKINDAGNPAKINTTQKANTLRIAVSRHHQGEKLKALLSKIDNYELVMMGSALKLCIVAEAKADIYLRLGPTSEWDTAAGQYVLECAGGKLTNLHGQPFRYNLQESLRNPAFLAVGDTQFDWVGYLKELQMV